MTEGPGFLVAPFSGTAIQGVSFGPMAMTSVDVTDMYDPCVTSMSEMESRSLTPLLLAPSLVERGMPVRITLPSGVGKWQCTVAGASAGTVLRLDSVQHGATLPTDGLAPGVYVVTVTNGTRRYSARFVVV